MIPTTFVVPAGYTVLKTGERKREGDRYLNRVCQPDFEWAWSAHVESGTDWNTLVRHDQTVIRPQPPGNPGELPAPVAVLTPASPGDAPAIDRLSTGLDLTGAKAFVREKGWVPRAYFEAMAEEIDRLRAPALPAPPPEGLEIILKAMETTPFAVSIWTIRDWALVLRAEFSRLQSAESLLHDMAGYKTHLEAEVGRLQALNASSTPAFDWTDPGHRLTEAELDVVETAYVESWRVRRTDHGSTRHGLECAVRAFLAYNRAKSPPAASCEVCQIPLNPSAGWKRCLAHRAP